MVAHRTLTPFVQVQILSPQPLRAINLIGRVSPLHGESWWFKSTIAHHENSIIKIKKLNYVKNKNIGVNPIVLTICKYSSNG